LAIRNEKSKNSGKKEKIFILNLGKRSVERRFKDFIEFRAALSKFLPGVFVPNIPKIKRVTLPLNLWIGIWHLNVPS